VDTAPSTAVPSSTTADRETTGPVGEGVEGAKETEQEKEQGHVLTTALSAHLYILPQEKVSILYISKLDSSGYPTTPLHLTRTFIVSALSYFLLPASRPTPDVRIQLFARSQGQYLFPNSAEGPKKVLGGLGLCGWWKGVYEDVAALANSLEDGKGTVKLGMVLPGYSADEAKGMLGQRKPLPPGLEWTATPPFYDSNLTASSSSSASSSPMTPYSADMAKRPSLADLIPSLPDDPKARFLDDLVSDGAEDPHRRRNLLKLRDTAGSSSSSIPTHSGTRSLQPSSSGTSIGTSTGASPGKRKEKDGHRSRVQAEEEAERRFTDSTLERVSKDEYWERMGFRQECISGDVTGFFSLESYSASPPPIQRTNSIGLDLPTSSPMPSTPTTSGFFDPKPTRISLPPSIVERVAAALINTDFKTYASAIEHTAIWARSVKSLVVAEIGEAGYEGCLATVEAKGVMGPPVVKTKREEAPVTMLQPRKKKKV
jgi:regulator of Ty1 transposition protein 109